MLAHNTHSEYFIITCISVFSFMPRLPNKEPANIYLRRLGETTSLDVMRQRPYHCWWSTWGHL